MTTTTTKEKPRRSISAKAMEAMRKKDNKLVKGIFRCFESPGSTLTFSHKKYAGDDVQQYTMTDGDTYDIPIMVAKHLNNNCCYDRHAHVLDANGKPSIGVGRKVHRYTFESLEFQFDDEMEEEETA